MGIFKKDPEPRSWGGQTASELAADSGGDKNEPYKPPQCTDSYHVTPVEIFRPKKNPTYKKMSCQTCGKNWTEQI